MTRSKTKRLVEKNGTAGSPADRESDRPGVALGVVDCPNDSVYVYKECSAMSGLAGVVWDATEVKVLMIDDGFALIQTSDLTGWIPSYFIRRK